MSDLCINCSQPVTLDNDFCDTCLIKMEQGVEMNVNSSKSKLVDTKSHGLFQTRKLTGKVLDDDDDIIANMHRNDDQNNNYFWMFIIVVLFLMALIVAIN